MIGTFGPRVVFETSDQRIFTFQGLNREVSGRWATHEVANAKPKKEFLGPGAQTLSFTVRLSAAHGVRPRATLEEIARLVESGETQFLVVGGKPVSSHPFALVSASESWGTVLSGGELVSASISLTLEEYT